MSAWTCCTNGGSRGPARSSIRSTAFFLVFYLAILVYGGISSSAYSLKYDQTNYSAWAPPMAPIKIIMTVGIVLMLLQAIAIFFRDVAKFTGREIE